MEKSKERGERLELILNFLKHHTFDAIMCALFGTFVLALVLVIVFGSIYVIQDITTSPEDRLAIFEESYNACMDLGVYPETCERAALEASGLAGESGE